MPYGSCQRCGWQYELRQIKTEWTNLRVCHACFDERPAQLSPIVIRTEGASLGLPPEGVGIEYGIEPFDGAIFDPAIFDTFSANQVSEADL